MYYLFKPENNFKHYISKYSDIYLFTISCILIIVIKCIQFPSLTLNAEMFAESGTNFFIHAYRDTIVTNFISTDAGYLPLAQRIVSVILVKVFHIVGGYAFASQAVAIFIIAIMSSLFTLSIFNKYCKSTLLRFIIGISIALISDYELNVFINFIYYGALLLFLGIFI